MPDSPTESSPKPAPLAYATADIDQRAPRVMPLAIVSICIACFSLLWNCLGETSAVHVIQMALRTPAIMQAQQRAQAMAAQMQQRAASQTAGAGISFRALTPQEIENVISYVNSQLQRRAALLNDAQSATLRKILSQDGQQLIDPDVALGSQIPGQLQMVLAWPSGHGSILLAANHGNAYTMYRTRLDASGIQTPYPKTPTFNFTPPAPISTAQIQRLTHQQLVDGSLIALLFGVGVLMAAVLMAGGIRLLQMNPQGLRLHWFYLCTKITVGTAVLIFSACASNSSRDDDSLLVFALIGYVYPVSLIFVLPRLKFR